MPGKGISRPCLSAGLKACGDSQFLSDSNLVWAEA